MCRRDQCDLGDGLDGSGQAPPGDKVAYHSAAGGAYEIRVLDLAADQDICLLRRAGNVSAVNPVWNAAGTSVACESNGDIFVVAVPDRVQDAEVTRNRPGPMTSGGRTAVRPSIGGWNALRHLKLSPYGRHSYVDRYHLIGAFDFDASYEYFKPGGTLSSMPGLARGVMVTGDPVLMRQLVSVADLMLRMARDTKQGLVWEYKQDSYAGPGPWISSYAQGYAITMAVAAHALSGDDRFIKAAHAALSPYEFPMKDGGVRTDVPGGGAWYEEYAAPTYRPAYVLNGHLFALYGALDLWRATGSERAERAFRDGLRGLKTLLPEFDDGTFSFYDLYPRQESGYPLGKGKPASLYYNHVVCKQLYWLWTVTGDTDFLARVLSFLPYSRQPDPLTVVSASNSMNEERYGVSWLTEGQVRVGPQYWSGRVPVVISLDLGMERWVHGVELFGLPRRMPQRFDVHVSLDGSDWTTALRTTHAHSGNPHEVYFLERPVRARFVRIDVLEPLGDYVLLTEVAAITRLRAMQRDPCPQPAPTEGVASVSAQACHESALENGRGSFVCSEFPTFLELCLPNHSRVEAVVLKMDAGEGAVESIASDLVVQVSSDGLGWTTIGLVQGAGPIVRVPVGHECRLVRVVVLGTSSAYPLVFRQLSAEMSELHASVPSPSGPREVASSVHREEGGDAVADISVLNGDFEMVDATDPTLPAGWWRKQGSAETIRVVPRTSGTEGDLILEIKPHPGGMLWQTLAQALPMPSEDLVYVVSFDGRVAGTGTGKVSLVLRSNERDHEVLGYTAFGGPEFQRHSFTARVPSDRGAELEIWLGQSNYRNMDCTIYYDNISVQAEEQ